MVKILVLCVHNSARSQIAETFLNDLGEGCFLTESAGLEKGELNPYVIKAMSEIGYDISNNKTNSVFDYFKEGRRYTYVIKVCDTIHGQRCPIFPNTLKTLNWNIPDPSKLEGDPEAITNQVRQVRDHIKEKVIDFINTHKIYAKNRKKQKK